MKENSTDSELSAILGEHNSLRNIGAFRMCCKPTYQMRRLKNKGAILVLFWNYLVMSVFYFLSKYLEYGYSYGIWLLVFGLSLPIAGWLADTYIKRYKVVHYSIWIMWAATVLVTVSSVIAQLDVSYYHINTEVAKVLFCFMAIGLGGFQANIIQFGVDQLHDASTTEITSFIIWYVWTLLSAGIVVNFTFTCLNEQHLLFRSLLIVINLSLVLVSLFCCDHSYWLVKEPAIVQDPFKLVYRVIRYAIVNKYPRHRSAFTYCEDELPTRIDFGKSKYGGPFKVEQVEDVKTFLRILPFFIVVGVLMSEVILVNYFRDQLSKLFAPFSESDNEYAISSESKALLSKCYSEASFTHTIYFSSTVLIVLHEVILYPVFHKCLPQIKSVQKLIIGTLLQLARVISLIAIEVISRQTSIRIYGHNETIQCVFYDNQAGALSTSFNYYWMAIPDFLQSISLLFFYVGGIEFACAQVPYSMKGLLFGVGYGTVFIAGAIGVVISLPFQKRLSVWGTGTISCGFGYAVLALSVEVIGSVTLVLLARFYKKRKRQDLLPNEHIFAEKYYSTTVSYTHLTLPTNREV